MSNATDSLKDCLGIVCIELSEADDLSGEKVGVGVTAAQRNRNTNIGDVLNIGSGTRCVHCGFLHFLWRATCGACERPMEYNLGHRDEKNRL